MKKIITAVVLGLLALSANADPGWNRGHHGHGYYRPGYNYNWAAPLVTGLVIGGAIGYATAPQFVVPPQPYPTPAPIGYHYQNVFDPSCNCYKTALVPN